MKKPKIHLLFCGGTIAMSRNKKGYLEPFFNAKKLLQKIPELNQIAEISAEQVVNIDSTNIQPHHWTEISKVIYKKYKDYDGFLVTHGTDTMVYSASAISFALRNLNKPIVFTGSQKPIDDIASDAKINLVNACKVATMNLAEVCIVFGRAILRGNRAKKKSEVLLDAFWSPVALPIGQVNLEPIFINSHHKKTSNKKLIYQPKFNPNVMVYEIIPGMNPKYLFNDTDNGVEGIVLSALGAGNVPHLENSLIPYIKKTTSLKIPVVVTTQCLEGSAQMEIYQSGAVGLEAGAISAKDMTHEAATVKLMWLLTQTKNIQKIKKLMQQNLADEITVNNI
ncbi:hypothetical protein A2W14_06755 [Candidatus Gottesmanbacteria bacterium RBG_16_37_8]|uniref:asparaginase n=1 Tax=Candidatus Gottesmanbacteria bacterium RBG_16_37_8 TaxID=1798371 RepID=A0A1F5YW96_9BACT|nr:MAG: hypothetical protein A2W14_06755 [Candidatus Gottesmanbacteria bacterium RBG_16_37_8]